MIIDGPPGISNISADAVRVADVVLIPVKASAFDVWAATDIVEAVKVRRQASNGTPKAAFVITMIAAAGIMRQQPIVREQQR